MTKLEKIEQEIASLDTKDVMILAAWFDEFKAELWDRQFESDVAAGSLDSIADSVLADHKATKTTPL